VGWLTDIFKKKETTQDNTYAEVMSGSAPIFTQFGHDIYASDVVQQAVNCIVSEMKKLRMEHIREHLGDIIPVNSDIQSVLRKPNPMMTESEFLEKISWILHLNYNAFIIPTYYEWKDKNGAVQKKLQALYPILPSNVDFIQDGTGRLFVKFRFANGTSFDPIKYSDVIHLKIHYGVNDFMGGNQAGQPDNDALLRTLQLNHQLLEGVAKSMKASFSVNGIVKYKTMMDDGKTEQAIKDLEAKVKKTESGILPLDLSAEYIPIKNDIKMVDKDTLEFIDNKILRHIGVSLPILTGDYTKEQYEAFYQKTLEPLIISYGQAFSKVLFNQNEFSRGNRIKFYAKELIFMSTDQKLALVNELAPTGTLMENEKRAMFGLRPLEELVGKRYISLNWIDSAIANKYQGGADNEQQQEDNESV
jgi:HK97 family phage portal protein